MSRRVLRQQGFTACLGVFLAMALLTAPSLAVCHHAGVGAPTPLVEIHDGSVDDGFLFADTVVATCLQMAPDRSGLLPLRNDVPLSRLLCAAIFHPPQA
jgi:hypothetical protein